MESAPEDALPVLTYSAAITIHLNGEEVHAFPVAPAHTDGDSYIHFRDSDVLHSGDVFQDDRLSVHRPSERWHPRGHPRGHD